MPFVLRITTVSVIVAELAHGSLPVPDAELLSSAELPPGAEALNLFGQPLYPINFTALQNESLTVQVAMARTALANDQCGLTHHDVDKVVWLGRRLAYQWRYQEALRIFSRELEDRTAITALAATKLHRHRGHRFLTTRQFGMGETDLRHAEALINRTTAADEWEPDGQPNAANLPLSTLHFNVRYHLGLSEFLQGKFEAAQATYARCLADGGNRNDESMVATAHWRYMALRRLGRDAEANATVATFTPQMRMLEDASYLNLTMMYQGRDGYSADEVLRAARASSLDFSTVGFGVANWFLVNGEKTRAFTLMKEVLASPYWAAFGYIACEADLFHWQST